MFALRRQGIRLVTPGDLLFHVQRRGSQQEAARLAVDLGLDAAATQRLRRDVARLQIRLRAARQLQTIAVAELRLVIRLVADSQGWSFRDEWNTVRADIGTDTVKLREALFEWRALLDEINGLLHSVEEVERHDGIED